MHFLSLGPESRDPCQSWGVCLWSAGQPLVVVVVVVTVLQDELQRAPGARTAFALPHSAAQGSAVVPQRAPLQGERRGAPSWPLRALPRPTLYAAQYLPAPAIGAAPTLRMHGRCNELADNPQTLPLSRALPITSLRTQMEVTSSNTCSPSRQHGTSGPTCARS